MNQKTFILKLSEGQKDFSGADLSEVKNFGSELRTSESLKGFNFSKAEISNELASEIFRRGAIGSDFSGVDFSGVEIPLDLLKDNEFFLSRIVGCNLDGTKFKWVSSYVGTLEKRSQDANKAFKDFSDEVSKLATMLKPEGNSDDEVSKAVDHLVKLKKHAFITKTYYKGVDQKSYEKFQDFYNSLNDGFPLLTFKGEPVNFLNYLINKVRKEYTMLGGLKNLFRRASVENKALRVAKALQKEIRDLKESLK